MNDTENMGMTNLFGDEFDPEKNECAVQPLHKKNKQKSKTNGGTASVPKMSEETPLGARQMQVKVYNDFYMYEAPEELETPKIGDVRKWLVAQGFSELTTERAQFVWINTDDIADKYLYAGVRFEKQG